MIQDTLIPVLQTRYWKIKIAVHGFPVCLIQLCFLVMLSYRAAALSLRTLPFLPQSNDTDCT